ncbi:E3 ubiquitin-protein ligase [Acorus calamus]|uniref:E3 ubiquitin-protein ligase n=1 Tax=Acorus calamus TaxID=4465 RepID=A0AAV9DYM3_ACOCL|nr:E3 ubiquitin-protein ligase [Acorus calamus]
MAVPSPEPHCEGQTDRHPLLMDPNVSHGEHEHVIDINTGSTASSSVSHEERPSSNTQPTTSDGSNGTNAPSTSDNNNNRRRTRNRSPLNSGRWISIEIFVNVSQIIASIVVLSLSRDENPQAPLFAWIVGYAAGCFATLPLLYWRFMHRNNQGTEQGASNARQVSSQNNTSDSGAYTAISIPPSTDDEAHQNTTVSWNRQRSRTVNARLDALVDHFKMALDCFFAVWFVVGNVWIFGGHSSASDAPNLYRLCIVFLTFSCIGYAMPFILCATICCCLPCIISILGYREDLGQTRGATSELINGLPTYKFKAKRNRNQDDNEIGSENSNDGGILAAGTDKERVISAEDAVCCICLAKYADNEELRELPCAHFFHMECVDKWLKINALCPLCKCEVSTS